MQDRVFYDNPLIERYASREMCALFGPQKKFSTWRRLWVALAEAEHEMGLPVSQEQIDELKAHVDDVDFDAAAAYEKKLRHDVMAHVHAYGDLCPKARGVIHLGATSCFVTDNADCMIYREALEAVRNRLFIVIDRLANFASQYRALPCLGFTHLQPAQPTTVGKRATLWTYDLATDFEDLEFRIAKMKTLGNKGTTGTQASFLKLFNGDGAKVRELEKRVCQKIGFDQFFVVSGQTYPRKLDSQILDVLSRIAQSAHKFAVDMRLLANRKELEEPFEKNQIGSSAMAYKRNPMRCERVCSLARFVMSLQSSPAMTAATQWMERTLDDSANRRLTMPQAFLAVDAILIIMQNVVENIVVYPKVIEKNLRAELPFMATENILMAAVEKGGDRQDLHERIRRHSVDAANRVKIEGAENDLIDRLKNDPAFNNVEVDAELAPEKFVGRAPEQVDEFIRDVVEPIRRRYQGTNVASTELRV